MLKSNFDFITFEKGNTTFKFLDTGDVFEISSGDSMINMFRATGVDGSLNNIYLRLYKDGSVKVLPMLGINSDSSIYYRDKNSLMFEGDGFGVKYKVKFTLANENVWFYEVDVYGKDVEFDILFCQDIAISNKKVCITNELYVSQYIEHKILESKNGYVVCSKQNQDLKLYVEHGSLNSKIISYSTDQMQFFSEEYKLTDIPKFLNKNLPKQNYQFELSYIALQTEKMTLNGNKSVIFYGLFKDNYEGKIENLRYLDEVNESFKNISAKTNDFKKLSKVRISKDFGDTLPSQKFSREEIDALYKNKKFEEFKEKEILSFFTNNHSHVVLQDKEILCERPHGNILITSPNVENLDNNVMATTNFMFGIFNSQMVVGNTSLNKMMSVNRGLLNTIKTTGQRIYIKVDSKFRLLTLAGIYEMGLNFSKWYYKINDDVLFVKAYTTFDSKKVFLEIESNENYEFIITTQLVMGEHEFETPCGVNVLNNKIRVVPCEDTFLKNTYPNIYYEMFINGCDFEVKDDGVFFDDGVLRNGTLLVVKTSKTRSFKIITTGSLYGEDDFNYNFNFDSEREKFNKFYETLLNGFNLEVKNSNYNVDKLNEIIYFYAQNALIHFISPHGLEQTNGAAWGTRDVCQGPVEFFLSTHNYKIVREIILKIFSYQLENGEWSQWFMFDRYNIQSDDSHGDVIFWPLKAIANYISTTGDYFILEEKCPYKSLGSHENTKSEIILNHIKKAISSISKRFIEGTYLINYGGGDWNDTLQPINTDLKERLVSIWTLCLAYQTFRELHKVIFDEDLKKQLFNMYTGIYNDFSKFAIKDDIISGFIYFENDKNIKYIIHPSDTETGIKYRLLPMTRSIISEIVSLNQAKTNDFVIEENLTFMDGVRLMNTPPKYNGGVCKIFKRAEQATNIGREISLLYVHAHIRYIESMCKLGNSNKVWESIFKILPINIKDSVKNSAYRQSNCYFSSSDGDFYSRYDFEENFCKLKSGDIKVKSGWRVYSSGSGIYINQLISNVIGIREFRDKVIFDPIFNEDMEEVIFSYSILWRKVKIIYKCGGKDINKIVVNGQEVKIDCEHIPYRNNFKSVDKDILKDVLKDEVNLIEIYMK